MPTGRGAQYVFVPVGLFDLPQYKRIKTEFGKEGVYNLLSIIFRICSTRDFRIRNNILDIADDCESPEVIIKKMLKLAIRRDILTLEISDSVEYLILSEDSVETFLSRLLHNRSRQKKETEIKKPPPKEKSTLEDKKKALRLRGESFRDEVLSAENKKKYPDPMLKKFIKYWAEPNRTYTKMKYDMQETWALAGRLDTWASRDTTTSTGAEVDKGFTSRTKKKNE